MFWDGDLPLWSPKGQGLLQGFKEGFLQNYSGESFPSNTGCFFIPPTSTPTLHLHQRTLSKHPGIINKSKSKFPKFEISLQGQFPGMWSGNASRKDSPNPWVLSWQISRMQQQSFKNHEQSQKSSKINNNHQTPSKLKKKSSFFGISATPNRFLFQVEASAKVWRQAKWKIAHRSWRQIWRWIKIGWYLEFGVCLLIFMFFLFLFFVSFTFGVRENVLLFCLLSFGHWASFGMISHQRCEE